MTESYLLLKWGGLKGWDNITDEQVSVLQKHFNIGQSVSAMAQHNTPEQKALLCQLIDLHEGEIQNDWSGEKYNKEQAKEYIMNYGDNK